MFRAVAAAVILFLTSAAAVAAPATPQLMGDRLRAGELAQLETELGAALAAQPQDDQVRFALGSTQFIRTIESMAQAMYRHGLEPPQSVAQNLPFFRFPLPRNPSPEPLDYEGMRSIFKQAVEGFARADATLTGMGKGDVKLPVAIGLARLDLNGDGKAEEMETLWRVMDASLGGGNLQTEQAERFIISFDRADATWLRGYTHLLRALLEFALAHDGRASFDAGAHVLFPRAGLPNAVLDQQSRVPDPYFDPAPIADVIAAIHLMHWEVKEPERMTAVLTHLETVAALSRESWSFILAETDDEAEWIPSPGQKNGAMPGITVSQQTLDGWMAFLGVYESILKGETLIPHWRLDKGINFRRVFTEPRPFDPILWAQGSAALPYLEDGSMADSQSWDRMMQMFGGNFLGYAVWFN